MTLAITLQAAAATAATWTTDPTHAADTKYRALFDSIDEGFCVIEVLFDAQERPVDYRFIEVNPSFERQTGLSDAVGRRMRELAPAHEEHWFRVYGEVALSGQSVRFDNRAEALHRWYDVYAFRVGEPAQHLVAILFNDISERKRAELALKDADRRKDEFIAILAHELRNPLAALRNALQVMRMAHGQGDAAERSQVIMERQVRHMVALVDDLMDASRISRGLVSIERRRIDLAGVVRAAMESAEPVVQQRGHALAVHLPAGAVEVDGDATRLSQALANLLVNAAKYTDPGGRLALSVERAGGAAVVRVADNGIGIPAEMLPRLFDLFTQAASARPLAQGGLGIGLALVKRIAELHGGSVEARSEGPGRGSEFTLRLPLAAPAHTTEPAAEAPLAPSRRHGRVLVADDNTDAAESLSALLQMLGHEVHTVFDGHQAVQATERLQPQVVLLDVGMPGMDGIAAARHIRAQPWGRAPALVAVTGWGQEVDRAATRAAGFDHHLVKPIDPAVLEGIVASALEAAGRPLP